LERALEELEELRKERNEFTRNVPASPVPASPAPSSDSVLNRLREEHAEELQAVINGHAENVNSLREQHNIVLQELRTTLETTKNDLSSKLETHRVEREAAIADLQRAHQVALDALQKDNELLASELETSIGASEEQRRQLKMKADQAMFELSRVRDEHQVAKTADYKQIAELLKGKAVLEKTIGELELAKADLTLRNSELEGVRADLAKRNSELENRWSKRTTTLPPQGPPPNLPLPPLPANAPAATQAGKIPSERTNSMSSAGHRSNESLGAEEDISQSKVEEEETSRLQLIEAERDKLRQQLEAGKASSKDAVSGAIWEWIWSDQDQEVKLQEQLTKAESLVKELADSRKTSEQTGLADRTSLTRLDSKLRAHLEDARQENKRASEACKQHMDELAERRSKMDELDSNRRHERDSLVAANAQVASLRAQLERAVDAKVNKKMNSKLKVGPLLVCWGGVNALTNRAVFLISRFSPWRLWVSVGYGDAGYPLFGQKVVAGNPAPTVRLPCT
jgi:kinesin family protein 4/21/27